MKRLVLWLVLMASSSAFGQSYKSCILFQFQKTSVSHLLLACDGAKLAEVPSVGRAPAGIKENEAFVEFEKHIKTSELKECFESQTAEAWFKSCRK